MCVLGCMYLCVQGLRSLQEVECFLDGMNAIPNIFEPFLTVPSPGRNVTISHYPNRRNLRGTSCGFNYFSMYIIPRMNISAINICPKSLRLFQYLILLGNLTKCIIGSTNTLLTLNVITLMSILLWMH